MTTITVEFHRKVVQARFDQAADGVMSDLSQIAALAIRQAAPKDTGFLADSTQAQPVGAPAGQGRRETRMSRDGQQVTREALPAPAAPRRGSGVHVGAEYAGQIALTERFVVEPAYQASQASLEAVCARRRLT
jgi:hypothetical protein